MKKNAANAIKIIFLIYTGSMLILRSGTAADAVKSSIKLCAGTVVPSMLPFMVLTSYMTRSGLLTHMGKPLERISRKLFNLPGEAVCIFLISMTGGFPIGEKTVLSALESGSLSRDQAKRMSLFCMGGGPAFIINTVGVFMAGSAGAGVILLISLTLSSFIIGFASRFFAQEGRRPYKMPSVRQSESSIADSVEDSAKAIISICAWIIAFSSLSAVILEPLPQKAQRIFTLLAEVTNACRFCIKNYPLPAAASVLGFGGFCVHCQVLPYIKRIGLSYRLFVLSRIVNGLCAGLISYFLFKLFPCSTDVFAPAGQIIPAAWSVSFPAAAAFALTVSLIILDLAPKEKI